MRRLIPLFATALLALGLSFSAGAQAPAAAEAASAPASAPAPAAPAASTPLPSDAALEARAEDLKREVIALNRDLLALEEELLYPASTQVNVFVSMDVGKLFMLESVQLKVDDKLVAQHLYTPAEVKALHRGGVQRLYVGNLRSGPHEITAFFTGQGPHERDYKRGTTLQFDKGSETRNIELKVRDVLGKLQPEFDVKVWP